MSLIQILRQRTDADIPTVESAMTDGGYSDSDFDAEYRESQGLSAEGLTPANKTLTIKHKATGTERGFDISGNPFWEEELKRAFRDQVFGH